MTLPSDAVRERIAAAIASKQIKAMQTDDYFAELLTLVREIHAMLTQAQDA